MKRKCTEAENRMIKACAADILSHPNTYQTGFRSSLVSVILGTAAGLGLGAVVLWKLSVSTEFWVRMILFICVIMISELFALIWQAHNKKKICKKRLPGDQFWVNGGTIIDYLNHPAEGAYLIFTEDDLTDTMGNPCCIMYPASDSLNVRYGDRILLVYNDAGAYIPLKLTERTRYFIPEYGPEHFGKVSWDKAVCIPHPAAIDMDRESSAMNEYEIVEFVKRCNHLKNICVKNWVGIILLSVLILFLFGLLFIFMVAGDVITEFSTAVIFVALLVIIWMVLSYKFAKAVLAGNIRGLKKIRYKKKVMFHSINDAYENNMYMKYVSVYEYINGVMELVPYPVHNNLLLPKNIPYGKIIYKYSKDAKSCAADLNFFA